MSIELLKQLDNELRRLFIAGSKLASGDLRLAKLQPAFAQVGQTSPVFAKIAQGVEQTIDPAADRPSAKLLELAALVRSILSTQGQTEIRGEQSVVTGTDSYPVTPTSFRQLNPVLLALTVKGQGRLEVIRKAHEDGIFRDHRLLIPAVDALDESYFEISDYLETQVIPQYGADALPVLLHRFRPDGGKGDARKLQLVHRILGRSGMPQYEEAAAMGSIDVRTAAIALLGKYPEQESFLLEQADDRRKEIRRVALLALANDGYTPKASDRIYKALVSKDRELAVEAIRRSSDDHLAIRTIDFAASAFVRWKSDGKQEEALDQLRTALEALRGHRTTGLFELVRSLLSDPAFFAQETSQLQELAAQLLLGLNSNEARTFAVSLKDTNKSKLVDYSLRAAVQILSPAEVYGHFAGYFAKGSKTSAAKLLLNAFNDLLPDVYVRMTGEIDRSRFPEFTMDPRWVEIFIQADDIGLVCGTAHTADRMTVDYLKAKCRESKSGITRDATVDACLGLFLIGCKDAPESVMNVLEEKSKWSIYYLDPPISYLLGLLPASYSERLAKFAAESSPYENTRNQIVEVADFIRTKPQDEQKGWVKWITGKMR